MSCKVNMTNGINFENHLYAKATALDASVKFAGEEAKDRLYESKHQKKLVRVLTVIAYVFFVSLAAIMLSLYYMFIWSDHKASNQPQLRVYTRCDNAPYGGYQQQHFNSDTLELRAAKPTSQTPLTVEEKERRFKVLKAMIDKQMGTDQPLFEQLLRANYAYRKKYYE